jgi:hypothetical protein
MGITRDEIDSFHEFATGQLDKSGAEMTFAELYEMWRITYPAPDELSENIAAIKAAIRDMENGDRGMPIDDHIREMRKKHSISDDR